MEILPESSSNSSAVEHSELYSLVFTVMNGNPSRVIIKQLCGSEDGVTISLQLSQNSRPPMLDHQDKYMMKSQVHVLKSFAIFDVQPLPQRKHYCQIYLVVKHMLRGRLLASFQDHEHEGGDTRSQGGIKDNDIKIKIQDHSIQMISQMNSQEQGSKIQERIVLKVVPPVLSFLMVPIDKVPVLQGQHLVPDRLGILLVELVEYPEQL
nr:hypothetical protein [Tanacetum cinerariifolium]